MGLQGQARCVLLAADCGAEGPVKKTVVEPREMRRNGFRGGIGFLCSSCEILGKGACQASARGESPLLPWEVEASEHLVLKSVLRWEGRNSTSWTPAPQGAPPSCRGQEFPPSQASWRGAPPACPPVSPLQPPGPRPQLGAYSSPARRARPMRAAFGPGQLVQGLPSVPRAQALSVHLSWRELGWEQASGEQGNLPCAAA